jgi:hypothetical protein
VKCKLWWTNTHQIVYTFKVQAHFWNDVMKRNILNVINSVCRTKTRSTGWHLRVVNWMRTVIQNTVLITSNMAIQTCKYLLWFSQSNCRNRRIGCITRTLTDSLFCSSLSRWRSSFSASMSSKAEGPRTGGPTSSPVARSRIHPVNLQSTHTQSKCYESVQNTFSDYCPSSWAGVRLTV